MSNPIVRLGEIHLLAWVLALPLLALALREAEDVLSFGVCAVFGAAYIYMALALSPRRLFDWLAARGLWPKLARLVFITVAFFYLGAIASLPFGPDVYWPMLVSLILAAGLWIAAVTVSLFAKPPAFGSL